VRRELASWVDRAAEVQLCPELQEAPGGASGPSLGRAGEGWQVGTHGAHGGAGQR